VKRLWRYLVAGTLLLVGRRPHREVDARPRLLPLEGPDTGPFEIAITVLFLLSALAFLAFPVLWVEDPETQYLGLTMGLGFGLLGTALATAGKTIVPQEESVEERQPLRHEAAETEVAQMVVEGDDRISRKKLVFGAAGLAGAAWTSAVLVSLDSMGPFLGTDRLKQTPWYAGRRIVDEEGKPIRAEDVTIGAFLMAFPEGAPKDDIASPINVIRLPLSIIHLPPAHRTWTPGGIMAFSRICPHAGCAVSMYRWPLYAPQEPKGPAFICPCHYSTFDPADGGQVLFGPAGRDLPMLPIYVGSDGYLHAAGTFDEPVGPSWWGVRIFGQHKT
jgi:ubiquinol-cytochrome c reductase iron-sulfur subunit